MEDVPSDGNIFYYNGVCMFNGYFFILCFQHNENFREYVENPLKQKVSVPTLCLTENISKKPKQEVTQKELDSDKIRGML